MKATSSLEKIDLNIKDAAKILGVHKDTIKYWEENNLIPPARRNPQNGYRVYNEQEIKEIAKSRGIFALEVDFAIKDKIKSKGAK
jgi:DNA-binding transcriptional MerR regulator